MEKTYRVPEGSPPERLDSCLAGVFPGSSRSYYQKLIKLGLVKVNGSAASADTRLKPLDTVSLEIPGRQRQAAGRGQDIEIIREDKSFAVINKPAGMAVHPSGNEPRAVGAATVLDIILDRYPALRRLSGRFPGRPGIVHRLDRDTSGAMIIAKTAAAQESLAAQFARREVSKTYLCIVNGTFDEKSGVIDAQIARDRSDGKKFRVGNGRKAVTKFRVAGRLKHGLSLLEVRPLTGRTHQIRVHLSYVGHPVLGDRVYTLPGVTDPYDAPRQMLHSYRIAFGHPATGRKVDAKAGLPADFRRALKELKI